MQTITLKPLVHRNQECIGMYFPLNSGLKSIVQNLPGAKWSQTNKCWYMPLSRGNYDLLTARVKPAATLDSSQLKNYLERKNKIVATLPSPETPVSVVKGRPQNTVSPQVAKQVIQSPLHSVSNHNLDALAQYVQQLKLKAYSPSTIKTYRNEFSQLLQTIKKKPVDTLTAEEIKRYMLYTMEKEGISENTAHSRLNALKFYFEQVLDKEKFFFEIPRPKKPLLLPKLLNENELRKLFNALGNKKHKAMLFTAYSAGLRVSEIVNLKIKDIDSGRMQIFISRAKGKKDRYVNLSPVLLDILRRYISTYKPKPVLYLFESEQTGVSYPARTVQQIFSNAKNKAGIKKDVGIHSLRHSFATHLLDKGTDIRYIKDLLGHFDIRTTERYLHVSKQELVNIISPLDDLLQKNGLEW
jgi:integrase/recombinase XerD